MTFEKTFWRLFSFAFHDLKFCILKEKMQKNNMGISFTCYKPRSIIVIWPKLSELQELQRVLWLASEDSMM